MTHAKSHGLSGAGAAHLKKVGCGGAALTDVLGREENAAETTQEEENGKILKLIFLGIFFGRK
ncbi:hypothetical protein QML37_30370 [Klebsiella pneumoniae]|uniref:hypothetical protein n=1 Tax=Klebsiella pneumoniae TaxID=573 RepID=UPI003A7F8931